MNLLIIKNCHIIDPANNTDMTSDILIKSTKIIKVESGVQAEGAEVLDAKGKLVVPGLIDMHAHLRQPGREDEETFATGSRAAARGGFTTVCAMPNTEPACDTRAAVEYVVLESKKSACIDILPVGAITVERKGENLTEMADMKKAGMVAVTDDGSSVKNAQLMRKALEYARMLDMLVISHCEDTDLSGDGVMNEGVNSTFFGLKGIPDAAEAVMVARDILLAELTKARLHIAHVSNKESLRLIKDAKKRGVNVTAETCPHYFALSDDLIKTYDTSFKVNPPIRTREDIEAIKAAIKDGTIDVISTDHAPHMEAEKDVEFDFAPFGMVGLETAFSVAMTELVEKKVISFKDLIFKMSTRPAQILGLKYKGSIAAGSDADIAIIDPDAEWVVKKEEIASKSKNSPFIGRKLKAKVLHTICNGRVVYNA